MPDNLNITESLSAPGSSISGVTVLSEDGIINESPTMPVGVAATLSTRTSDTAGIFNVGESKGYEVGDIVAFKFSTGFCYSGEVTDYTGSSLTVESFAGDALPLVTSTGYVAVLDTGSVIDDKTIEGDSIDAMGVGAPTNNDIAVIFSDAVGVLKAFEIPANGVWIGKASNSTLSEFDTKTITEVAFYNFGTTSASARLLGGTTNIAS